jgi:hypothetical protein
MSYVGCRTVASVDALKGLIEQYAGDTAAYFLRWSNRVSGVVSQLPKDFDRAEGQMFNQQLELRWKREGKGYSVLLLSQADGVDGSGFAPLPGNWQVEVHAALMHDQRNPQYPNRFQYQGIESSALQQCYFRNAETGVVHFIALTLRPIASPQASAA